MPKALRLVLLVVMSLAVSGATTPGAVAGSPGAMSAMAMGAMPCGMVAQGGAGQGTTQMPCEDMTLDCFKAMGSASLAALPARPCLAGPTPCFGTVAYWTVSAPLSGMSRAPDRLPPRTA